MHSMLATVPGLVERVRKEIAGISIGSDIVGDEDGVESPHHPFPEHCWLYGGCECSP